MPLGEFREGAEQTMTLSQETCLLLNSPVEPTMDREERDCFLAVDFTPLYLNAEGFLNNYIPWIGGFVPRDKP